MKTLVAVFLLFTSVSLSLGQESPDPVRDTDGNLVRSGTEYYILPVFRGRGGGLTLAPTKRIKYCQETLVEETMYEGQLIVTAHGVSGNPGRETISNWFKIEKYDQDYKIVFCPTVCDLCRPVCGDIGVKIDENGNRRLAISDVPFKIFFKKA